MKYLVYAACLLAALIYASYYFKYPSETTILQTTLSNFKFQLLLEKQPIVIQDQVHNLSELKDMWFYSYMSKMHAWTSRGDKDPSWETNKYKYLLLQPGIATSVYIYPRGKPMTGGLPAPDATLIEIVLKEHQVLILPYKYRYHFEKSVPVQAIASHDIMTMILP